MCHRCIKPVAALATIQMMCPGTLVFFKTKFRILGIHIRILGVHPFARDSNKSGVGKDGKNADIWLVNWFISETIEDGHITMENW